MEDLIYNEQEEVEENRNNRYIPPNNWPISYSNTSTVHSDIGIINKIDLFKQSLNNPQNSQKNIQNNLFLEPQEELDTNILLDFSIEQTEIGSLSKQSNFLRRRGKLLETNRNFENKAQSNNNSVQHNSDTTFLSFKERIDLMKTKQAKSNNTFQNNRLYHGKENSVSCRNTSRRDTKSLDNMQYKENTLRKNSLSKNANLGSILSRVPQNNNRNLGRNNLDKNKDENYKKYSNIFKKQKEIIEQGAKYVKLLF